MTGEFATIWISSRYDHLIYRSRVGETGLETNWQIGVYYATMLSTPEEPNWLRWNVPFEINFN